MVWYYAEEGRQKGPVSDAEFDQLLSNGKLLPDTLVWKDGMEDWQPMSAVSPPAAGVVTTDNPSAQYLFPSLDAPSVSTGGGIDSRASLLPQDGESTLNAPPTASDSQQGMSNLTAEKAEHAAPQQSETKLHSTVAGQFDSRPLSSAVYSGGAPASATVQFKSCADCGTTYPAASMHWFGRVGICSACKPKFLENVMHSQSMQTSGNLTLEWSYVGVIRRAFAKLADLFLMSVVFTYGLVLLGAQEMEPPPTLSLSNLNALEEWADTQRPLVLGFLALGLLYNTIMITGFGSTIGKFLFRCRVIQSDGQRAGIGHAFLRASIPVLLLLIPHVSKDLGSLAGPLLLICYAVAVFDSEKRTLIDRICDTRVVRM